MPGFDPFRKSGSARPMERRCAQRRRGVVLTDRGQQRLQGARRELEARENGGDRLSLEDLSARSGLSVRTVAKVLDGRTSVDRQTLAALFACFALALERSDYRHPGPEASSPPAPVDWGEAPEVSVFHGREPELRRLGGWLAADRPPRLIAVLGMGGMGKTALVTRLLQTLPTAQPGAPQRFDAVIWRSLRNAPSLATLLEPILAALAPEAASAASPLERLAPLIRQRRLLLVLDNLETLLEGGTSGSWRPGWEAYGELLRLFAATDHRSQLILTSREQPLELAEFAQDPAALGCLRLAGCPRACQALLRASGLTGTAAERDLLAERCGHSPLGVKLIAGSIRDLCGGDIRAFLGHQATLLGGLRRLLDQQFGRLSPLEATLMLWLAIRRESTAIADLAPALVPPVPAARLLEAFAALQRRSLVETQGSGFSLQPVVMAYATEHLVELVAQALSGDGPIQPLHAFPLLLACARDPIRDSQRQLILEAVSLQLQARLGTRAAVARRLKAVLADLPRCDPQASEAPEPSYAAGSLVNLLHHLGVELDGLDLAGLAVWQAHLPGVPLPRLDLSGADLRGSVLTSSFGAVFAVAVHPDGSRFATGEITGTLRLWHRGEGQPRWSVAAERQWIWALAFSPDGSRLASSGGGTGIGLWESDSGRALGRLEGHTDQVHGLAFDRRGERLASASADGSVRLWSMATGACLQVLAGHGGAVLAVAFHPDGDRLVSAGADGCLRVWETASGRCLRILQGQMDQVRCLDVHPDGQWIASGGGEGLIHLWPFEGHAPAATLSGQGSQVLSLQFSPDGTTLASSGTDHTIRLWEFPGGGLRRRLTGPMNWSRTVRWSPDGRWLLSGCSDCSVRLWAAASGEVVRSWSGHSRWMWDAAFSPDGRWIVSAGGDRSVRVWEAASGALQRTLRGSRTWVISVDVDPGGRWIASTDDRRVELRDFGSGRLLQRLEGHASHVLAVRFSPAAALLATGGSDYSVRLWDPEQGTAVAVLAGHRDWIRSLAFSGDGRLLASASHEGTAKVWELATGRCLRTLEGFGAWVLGVAFLPDGEGLVSASGAELTLWHWSSGRAQRRFAGHASWIRSVAVSPDGRWLASGSTDGVIHLWDLATGRRATSCLGHTDQILALRFHPDGESLVSGSADETLRLWDRASGRCRRRLEAEALYAGMRIGGVRGLSSGAVATLKALGAVEPEA